MQVAESFTAFQHPRRIVAGELTHVAQAVIAALTLDATRAILILDDQTGHLIELDLRHGAEHSVAEYRTRTSPPDPPATRPGRGRPKLGVVAREVTLLPRHWDWLAGQPGGASAVLRRLVEEARRTGEGPDRVRRRRDATYRAMSVLAGDLPGFEEASRALFADDTARLDGILGDWPTDIAAYLRRLATQD